MKRSKHFHHHRSIFHISHRWWRKCCARCKFHPVGCCIGSCRPAERGRCWSSIIMCRRNEIEHPGSGGLMPIAVLIGIASASAAPGKHQPTAEKQKPQDQRSTVRSFHNIPRDIKNDNILHNTLVSIFFTIVFLRRKTRLGMPKKQ